MSEAVVECPALCEALLDKDVLTRTVKFNNTNYYGNITLNDVVEIMKKEKIRPDDIETISRGQSDKEVSVVFTSTSPLNYLQKQSVFEVNHKKINMIASGKQIVFIRVHWLPVYASNTLVEAIMQPFGKVLSVEDTKVKVDQVFFKSGVRVVKMEVTDIERAKLPHLLRFECGSKALITVPGRPPLCLKCLTVGHYRNECYGKREHNNDYYKILKSFAEFSKQKPTEKKDNIQEEENSEQKEDEQRSEEQSRIEIQKEDVNLSESSESEDDDQMEEESTSRGVKRATETDEVTDSFQSNFPPQKSKRPSVVSSGIGVSNPFSVLAEESETLQGPDSAGEHGTLDGIMDGILDLQGDGKD